SGTVRPGDWLTRSREAGKLADPGPQPDKAPLISYMKGALLHSAAERIPVTRDTPTDTFRLAAFRVCRVQGWWMARSSWLMASATSAGSVSRARGWLDSRVTGQPSPAARAASSS